MTSRISSRLANFWRRWPITIVTTTLGLLVAGLTYIDLSDSLTPTSSSIANVQNTAQRPLMSSPETRNSETPSTTMKHTRLSGFRRVQVTPNEIDYIAEDVTMRVFTSRPKHRSLAPPFNQVDIGDDVTVRYFADKVSLPSQATAPSGISK